MPVIKYQKNIQYFGQPVTVACDGKCHKAWGWPARPRSYTFPEDHPEFDEDAFELLSDDELPDAPDDPGSQSNQPATHLLFSRP